MMPTFIDRTGQRFGRLVVVDFFGSKNGRSFWNCRCDCGSATTVMSQSLVAATTVSCGCFHRDVVRKKGRNITHNCSKTDTYKIWAGIKKRCLNPKNHAYPRYGGRGIKICERWLKFENFLADMGERPAGLTIERKNNDGDYEPENCIWASYSDQNKNRKNTRKALYKGELLTLGEISKISGIKYATVYYRAFVSPRAALG